MQKMKVVAQKTRELLMFECLRDTGVLNEINLCLFIIISEGAFGVTFFLDKIFR